MNLSLGDDLIIPEAMKKVLLETVLRIINRVYPFNITEKHVNDNLTDLGMDSIIFIQIIIELEREFVCEIPDDWLTIEKMNTVSKILDTLQELYDTQSV